MDQGSKESHGRQNQEILSSISAVWGLKGPQTRQNFIQIPKWDIMYECSKVSEPLFLLICILLVGGFPNILDDDDDDTAEEEW